MTDADFPDARRILAQRLAAGEITEEDYDRLLGKITSSQSGTSSASPAIPSAAVILPRTLQNAPVTANDQISPDLKPMAASTHSHPNRLGIGGISLPAAFWGWGVLGGFVVSLTVTAFSQTATTRATAAGVLIAGIAYAVFVTVVIWKSANVYKFTHPNKSWGRVAKTVAVLRCFAGVGQLVQALPGNTPIADLQREVEKLNVGTPKMLGEKTRLDNFKLVDRKMLINITILGPTHVPEPSALANGQREMVGQSCADAEVRRGLMELTNYTKIYHNEAGQELMSFAVTEKDCIEFDRTNPAK